MLLAHGSSMPKLGYFVILQTEIMPFGISRNIKYYQEVWKNLSVEILWQFLTAGHSVYLRPWPAVPQLVVSITKQFFAVYTTDTSSINWSNVKPKYFLGSLYISKETPNTFNRSDWGFQSKFGEYFWLPGFCLLETVTGSRIKTIVISLYAQAYRIRPLQIHNNFRIAWLFQTNIAFSH